MIRKNFNRNDLGGAFALTVSALVAVSLVVGMGPMDKTWWQWVANAILSLSFGACAFIYARATKTDVLVATKLNVKPPLAHVGWGCLGALCLMAFMLPINEWLLDAIQKAGLARPSVDLPNQVVPMIIVACFLPAFTEEIIFRGVIANSLHNCKKWVALAVSGGLFALFHTNPAQTIYQFALGAWLALLVFRSGSVIVPMIVHLFNNLLVVVMSFTLPDSFFEKYQYVLLVVGAVGFVGSVFGYLYTTKSRWQQQKDVTPITPQSKLMLLCSVLVCAMLWIATLLVKNEV